ncbi:MAG TPA: bifunctional acetate--CoA ligase family protein/GNAT family N-acetyltransferase [Patescibacteria group bacterium]|nr:bifunctional acetate--CoA ligase family protein/GNAT family N-acetyltransferase [Patescibacteria group bacterium]
MASDVLGVSRNPLDSFFSPSSVAVIGATEKEGSVGRTVFWNLISSPFGGTVYPVNQKRSSILGVRAYPSIAALPERPELVVIATPAPTIPATVEECAAAGVKAVVIISAGFKEIGPEGAELERQILAIARAHGMRIVGPNCLGVMRPPTGLNATFAAGISAPGTVGFVSQSGALLTAVLDWSVREKVGFSAVVSLGSMLDVGWGDLITYFGNDPATHSIVVYMETIGDARAFLSAAREVALSKPIIVIKPGRTAQAAKAAASHTGSLTGSDEVLAAAFARVGVLRVDAIADLFNVAEVLAKQPRATGRRLTILTNAGGPGVLATDALITGGGELSEISAAMMEELNTFLPGPWSHNNPIDIIGDAAPDRYARALEVAARDGGSDGLLVILTPQAMTDPTATARELVRFARIPGKPVLASWMGGEDVAAGTAILREAGIPTFDYPDDAAKVFNHTWKLDSHLRQIYETPTLPSDEEHPVDRARAEALISTARAEGRTLLTEDESKDLLAAYGIPITETIVAPTIDDAVAASDRIGYPVVVKLYSHTITHKTDVGGVQLNLKDADAVRHAYELIRDSVAEKKGDGHFEGVTVQPMVNWTGYELIIGSSIDPQFGPVLLFGMGGQLVEVFRDRALGLPPLTTTLARRMMENTKVYTALKGVRGRRGVDLDQLEQLLVRFSQLVVEQRWISELDINPLLASPERLIALDARVVLHDPATDDSDLPRLAIRPYPQKYVSTWTCPDGQLLRIRPIRPEDEPLLVEFHASLSEETVFSRYLRHLGFDERTAHKRLIRICFLDYDREMALVAESDHPETGSPQIVGIGRLSRVFGTDDAEFAVLVTDAQQGKGVGTELLRRLVDVARAEGVVHLGADMRATNLGIRRAAEKVGFTIVPGTAADVLRAEMLLA